MKKIYVTYLLLLLLSCRDRYDLPVTMPPTGYLVVEGTINSGQGATTISLTRSLKLVDSFAITFVRNAVVRIEGKDNSNFPLTESGPGQYTNPQLQLSGSQEYRLYVRVPGGKEYRSAFAPIKRTPPISSVSWERDNGVAIYVNTRDPQNNTRYYRWEYEDTWEFSSPLLSSLKYETNPATGKPRAVFRDPVTWSVDWSIWKCWKNEQSRSIEIASTAKLSQDTAHYQIRFIKPRSWELGILYSIKVKQFALSKECYEYLSKMKRNTEQTGSIFDAQPSQLRGNIQCVTDPNEMVIGFIEVADVHERRIFISNSQVQGWGYSQVCIEENFPNNGDSILARGMPFPTTPFEIARDAVIVLNATTDPTCVDCTLRGSNVKPSFWP